MGLFDWLFSKKPEPTIPVGTLTLRVGDRTVQLTFQVTGKALPAQFHHFDFVPATVAVDYGTNADVHVFAVDQYGARTPATVQSITSPDPRFTVKPIAGGFNVAFGGAPSAVDVVATLTGQAS